MPRKKLIKPKDLTEEQRKYLVSLVNESNRLEEEYINKMTNYELFQFIVMHIKNLTARNDK